MTLSTQDNNAGHDATIVCDGDSLTESYGSSNGDTYPKMLNAMLGMSDRMVINQGIGGQTFQQIAGRIGAVPVKLTATGGSVAGTADTAITAISNAIGSTPADIVTRYFSGTVNGQNAILTRVPGATIGSADSYLIKCSDGVAMPVSNSIFVPDNALNSRNKIQIHWWGRNNTPDFTGLVDALVTAANNMSVPKRFLVIGVLNSLNESKVASGSPLINYNAIVAVNATLKTAFGDRFIESTPPTAEEMATIDYIPVSADATEIANGVFPTTMHFVNGGVTDNTHLNSIGYKIIALRAYRKILQFGW